MTTVISRAYNTFTDVPYGLIKKESKTERLYNEILYYRYIQRDINKAILFPRVLASSIHEEVNWLIMEKYGYWDIGKHLLQGDVFFDSFEMFNQLGLILIQMSIFSDIPEDGNPEYTKDMYIDKTEREYQALVTARPDLQELFDSTFVDVNGERLNNFKGIWNSVRPFIEQNMLNYKSAMIHGDLCFSNILYEPSSHIFKFIDPRGSFGKVGIFGDVRYDIAKLYHSVDGGYEWFISDNFKIYREDKGYRIYYQKPSVKDDAQRAFEQIILPAFNKKEIKIIQGCIFIGMCARHYDSTERQLGMYLTGVRLLNEAMNL